MNLSETAPLASLVVKHARDAFVGPAEIERQWRDLSFTSAPDFARAIDEYETFLELLVDAREPSLHGFRRERRSGSTRSTRAMPRS